MTTIPMTREARRDILRSDARNSAMWLQTYIWPSYERARLATADGAPQKLSNPAAPAAPANSAPQKTVVRVARLDTFAAAKELHQQHRNDKIAVLNMANANTPGGGWLDGAMAQEEDLCHCSTLHRTLHPRLYPIRPDELIYSTDVLVIKSKDLTGDHPSGILMDESKFFYTDVISCPAISFPRTSNSQHIDSDRQQVPGMKYEHEDDRQLMRRKITNIMNAALLNGVNRLVLGALGCGVFKNPVWEVARMMKAILLGNMGNPGGAPAGPHPDWARYGLLEIVIAIYDTSSSQEVWNGFMDEWRQGEGLHRDPNAVPVPDHIQYTVFPPAYVGVSDATDAGADDAVHARRASHVAPGAEAGTGRPPAATGAMEGVVQGQMTAA